VGNEGCSRRKRIMGYGHRNVSAAEPGWVDIGRLAQVEITSEDVNYPIEAALNPGTGLGWRAAQPGEQTSRLLFDELRCTQKRDTFFERVWVNLKHGYGSPVAPQGAEGRTRGGGQTRDRNQKI